MWFYILSALVLYVVLTTNATKPAKNAVYAQMVKNGEDGDTIRAYLEMEDALLMEKNPSLAIQRSNAIKEQFPNYDFGHHTTLIKSIYVYSSTFS